MEDNVTPINAEVAKAQEVSQVPTAKDKEATVRALVEIHTLLGLGTFGGNLVARLYAAKVFLENLHAKALADLEASPDYVKEVSDGPAPKSN